MFITESYRELNRELHAKREDYGTSGHRWAGMVHDLAEAIGSKDILDYGCGKGTLSKNLPFEIKQYDPAISEHSAEPEPADIVVCTDVLEHIEPECLSDVLGHLERLTKSAGIFVIATRPAKKTLSDGRNAHISLHSARWWMNEIWKRFEVLSFQDMEGEFLVTVTPLEAHA